MTEADIINSVYPIIQKISKDSKPYVRSNYLFKISPTRKTFFINC